MLIYPNLNFFAELEFLWFDFFNFFRRRNCFVILFFGRRFFSIFRSFPVFGFGRFRRFVFGFGFPFGFTRKFPTIDPLPHRRRSIRVLRVPSRFLRNNFVSIEFPSRFLRDGIVSIGFPSRFSRDDIVSIGFSLASSDPVSDVGSAKVVVLEIVPGSDPIRQWQFLCWLIVRQILKRKKTFKV